MGKFKKMVKKTYPLVPLGDRVGFTTTNHDEAYEVLDWLSNERMEKSAHIKAKSGEYTVVFTKEH